MQLKLHGDELVLDGMTQGGYPCVVAVCDDSLTRDAKKSIVRNNNVGEAFLLIWERERNNMHIKSVLDLLVMLDELWSTNKPETKSIMDVARLAGSRVSII